MKAVNESTNVLNAKWYDATINLVSPNLVSPLPKLKLKTCESSASLNSFLISISYACKL